MNLIFDAGYLLLCLFLSTLFICLYGIGIIILIYDMETKIVIKQDLGHHIIAFPTLSFLHVF